MGGLLAKGLSKRKKDSRNIRFLYVYDDSETFVTGTYIMNALTPEKVAKKYVVRRTRLFEAHILSKIVDEAGLSIAETYADQFLGFGKDVSDIDEYFSQRVVLPETVIVKADMTYFMPLFVLYLILCILAFVLLLIEMWVANE